MFEMLQECQFFGLVQGPFWWRPQSGHHNTKVTECKVEQAVGHGPGEHLVHVFFLHCGRVRTLTSFCIDFVSDRCYCVADINREDRVALPSVTCLTVVPVATECTAVVPINTFISVSNCTSEVDLSYNTDASSHIALKPTQIPSMVLWLQFSLKPFHPR